jgi:oligopeptide/dipeptide ABC transporter ATP-binding protein
MSDDANLIDVVRMKKYFPIRGGFFKRPVGSVKAVDDVSFFIKRGETLGLVGESGCGKTTVGRAIMMLTPPTEGHVFFETPKEVVRVFTEVYDLLAHTEPTKMGRNTGVRILEGVDKLVSSPECDMREDKAARVCRDASELAERIRTRSKRVTEEDVRELAEAALEDVAKLHTINFKRKAPLRRMRSRIQFVFQDPFSSLDPKMLVKDVVAEPVQAQLRYYKLVKRKTPTGVTYQMIDKRFKAVPVKDGAGNVTYKIVPRKKPKRGRRASRRRAADTGLLTDKMGLSELSGKDLSKKTWTRDRVLKLLERVGLNVEHMYRFPHEFSGGQRQRIGIARALSVNPDFVVLDEPTSALDVSVQAQILNMLNDLQDDFGLTYLFISHDLSTIRYMCDRVAVMYLGKIVEYAVRDELFGKPTHPYTEALLSVIPAPDPDLRKDRIILTGDVPSPANPPPGCRFHTRCPLVIDICSKKEPPLTDRGNEHYVACHVR